MPKFRATRRKKIKFHGNRHTRRMSATEVEDDATANNTSLPSSQNTQTQDPVTSSQQPEDSLNTQLSISHTKVTPITTAFQKKTSAANVPCGNRILDIGILGEVFSIFSCPGCNDMSTVKLLQKKKEGLSFEFELFCESCEWFHTFWSSKRRKKRRSFDINSSIYYAMRRIGKGYKSIVRFLYLINHPPPMSEKTYRIISENFNGAIKAVAKKIMKTACDELHTKKNLQNPNDASIPSTSSASITNDDTSNNTLPVAASNHAICDVGVSVDGTWQRRGFSSLNGAVAVLSIDTGKVLDVDIMSRYCQGCTNAKRIKYSNPIKYERLLSNHICRNNHAGSAPAMELSGAKNIFQRSIEVNQLRYMEYYGDGDSKSFTSVENVYAPDVVKKQECIGHVQKRVGTRLRELKKKTKGLGGRGKLTDVVIDRLQNYYGVAVRSNVGNLKDMQSGVMAALFHVASSKDNNYHAHCPTGPESWCKFNLDKINGTSTYKPGVGLPLEIIKHVKPIFVALADDKLLSKCLHGKTQNQNESFNGMIWNRAHKETFIKLIQFENAVYDSVAHFNVGNQASLDIYNGMGIDCGFHFVNGCHANNEFRLSCAAKQSSSISRTRRKLLRGKRKAKGDKNLEIEGQLYGAGSF